MSCGRAVRPYAAWMLAGVAAITALRWVWLALQPADLFPDEAQYWVWSQHLTLGYYSADLCEPPGRLGLCLRDLDRCPLDVVLVGGPLRLCPSA